MPKILIDINNCSDCLYLATKTAYSADSFDRDESWFCSKKEQMVNSSVSWNEARGIPIPSWCPILFGGTCKDEQSFNI
jgi:hypothetical protein